MSKIPIIDDILNIIMAHAKDEAYKEAMNNIKNSLIDLSEKETLCRRAKSSCLIKEIANLDFSLNKFENSYNKLKDVFNDEAKEKIESLIKEYEIEREKLVMEKNRLSKS